MDASVAIDVVVVGAGAAGLMAARELARAGRRVTVLEARERCGGRIAPLPAAEFGYAAEGGAEFVHGAAPVTRELLRQAGLQIAPRGGARWSARGGLLRPDRERLPEAPQFYRALAEVAADLPIAEFLDAHFAGSQHEELRRSIIRMVEGYDAADPRRASTFAIRDEWLARDDGEHGRVAGGYGALIAYLAADCRAHGGAIRCGAEVRAIAAQDGGLVAHCRDGAAVAGAAAVLAVPLPLIGQIALPAALRERAAAAAGIGFGNVVKLLLRFRTRWWAHAEGRDLADLSFVLSEAAVPTWWTQYPADHPVLTGWLAGPRAAAVGRLDDPGLVELGLSSLAEIFAVPAGRLRQDLVAARALDWGRDRFAGGAYSYATPDTRRAQARLQQTDGSGVYFTGEALYAGADMGTVEAALASGRDTAGAILAAVN